MKKIFITFFLFLSMYSVNVYSQETGIFQRNKSMKCSSIDNLMVYIMQNDQKVEWLGKESSSNSYLALYKSNKTGNWTMIQYDEQIGCILGTGQLGVPT